MRVVRLKEKEQSGDQEELFNVYKATACHLNALFETNSSSFVLESIVPPIAVHVYVKIACVNLRELHVRTSAVQEI